MRRTTAMLVALPIAALLVAAPATQAARSSQPSPTKGSSQIVVYTEAVKDPRRATARLEARLGFRHRHLYRRALRGFSANLSSGQVRSLRRDRRVASVSADRPVKASFWWTRHPGDVSPSGVRRIKAATNTHVHRQSGVNVAVLDTGIDLSHPDLNVANGVNCITPSLPAQDDNGNGTHHAGTIAARNNGSGVTGVAPGTKVYAVKVLNASGIGSFSTVLCGIDWVEIHRSALNIRVANLSLGGTGVAVAPCSATTGPFDPLHIAICNATDAGVHIVAPAGNTGAPFDLPVNAPRVPAAYPEVLTVTAMADSDGLPGAAGGAPSCHPIQTDDRAATFSSFALTAAGRAHTIAAPGVCITSTWKNGGYATRTGTSMAAPHVAGVVALCINEANVAGPCASISPAASILHLRYRASLYTTSINPPYFFTGDPSHPLGLPYYGFLPEPMP